VKLGQETLGQPLSSALESVAEQLLPGWSKNTIVSIGRILAAGKKLGIEPSLWDVQNIVISSLEQRPPKGRASRAELDAVLEELGIASPSPTRRRRTSRPAP